VRMIGLSHRTLADWLGKNESFEVAGWTLKKWMETHLGKTFDFGNAKLDIATFRDIMAYFVRTD
jgi:hypothetical protein